MFFVITAHALILCNIKQMGKTTRFSLQMVWKQQGQTWRKAVPFYRGLNIYHISLGYEARFSYFSLDSLASDPLEEKCIDLRNESALVHLLSMDDLPLPLLLVFYLFLSFWFQISIAICWNTKFTGRNGDQAAHFSRTSRSVLCLNLLQELVLIQLLNIFIISCPEFS